MFTLTFNGKPFDPDDFHDALMEAALDKVKNICTKRFRPFGAQ